MYKLLLCVVTIIIFYFILATSSLSDPLAMIFLGAGLIGISSSTTRTYKK